MPVFAPEVEVAVARVRDEVAALHADLLRRGLVSWTDGNVSGRVPGADLFVITPAGRTHPELGPETVVLCDLDGVVVRDTPGWERPPSVHTAAHARVYRDLPSVGGVAHTHSAAATAWAARGEAIPTSGTGTLHELGDRVPLALGDDLGLAIVTAVGAAAPAPGSSAALLPQHGLVAVGADATAAVGTAALVEHTARIAHLAREPRATTSVPDPSGQPTSGAPLAVAAP